VYINNLFLNRKNFNEEARRIGVVRSIRLISIKRTKR
jgi:hypothetical protein